jgi:hypothetical protein
LYTPRPIRKKGQAKKTTAVILSNTSTPIRAAPPAKAENDENEWPAAALSPAVETDSALVAFLDALRRPR